MVFCIVCKARSENTVGVKFFSLPTIRKNPHEKKLSEERRALWLERINKIDFHLPKSTSICSAHFVFGRPSELFDKESIDWAPSLLLNEGIISNLERNECAEKEEQAGNKGGGEGEDNFLDMNQCRLEAVPCNLENYEIVKKSNLKRNEGAEEVEEEPEKKEGEGEHNFLVKECKTRKLKQELIKTQKQLESLLLDFENDQIIKKSLQYEFKILETEFRDSKIEFEKTKFDLKETRKELERALLDLESNENVKKELEHRLKILETEFRDSKIEFEKTKIDLKETRKELERALLDLESNQSEKKELEHNLKNLETEFRDSKIEFEKTKIDLKETRKELQDVKTNSFLEEGSFENDDVKVKFYTGLTSFALLKLIFELVTDNKMQRSLNSSLSLFQEFLLVLMRLRLNLLEQDLAYRFGICQATVSNIINKWLPIMATRLKCFIVWPERDELRKTMPQTFRDAFGDKISVIIDCFEVFIDKPSSLLLRTATYSQYKHHNTVKFLIGITPQGSISFISNAWAGRTSDKEVTENCGVLDFLQKGDFVLADRGFNIEDSVGFYCAKLYVPAYTKGKPQLSKEDVEETRKKANVRIHVERVIGLVRKKYRILEGILPIETLTPKKDGTCLIDQIAVVCCALTNLCPGIVIDEIEENDDE